MSFKKTILTSLAISNIALGNPVDFFDESRARLIPTEVNRPKDEDSPTKLAIISTGYGVKENEYTYLSDFLITKGYYVVCVRHELDTDQPLPSRGNLYKKRLPVWERGVENIRFVLSEIYSDNTNIDSSKTLLIGHSNGGDISTLFATKHPTEIATVITLDHRRMPIPRSSSPQFMAIRADEFPADPGVLPTEEEQKRYNIQVVVLPHTKHISFSDIGNDKTKNKVTQLIKKLLITEQPNQHIDFTGEAPVD